jgi:hypothetical protein
MAIEWSTEYAVGVNAPSAEYPGGSAKNATTPTSTDGFPNEVAWLNDFLGFFARLISEAGITVSGSPDTVLASDYFDALQSLNVSISRLISGSTTIVDGDNEMTFNPGQLVYDNSNVSNTTTATLDSSRLDFSAHPGTTYEMTAGYRGKGVLFTPQDAPGDNSVFMRSSSFDVVISDVTIANLDEITYAPASPLRLTGIPYGSTMYGVSLEIVEAGFTMSIPLGTDMVTTSGDIGIIRAQGKSGKQFSPASFTGTATITVTYNPSLVD